MDSEALAAARSGAGAEDDNAQQKYCQYRKSCTTLSPISHTAHSRSWGVDRSCKISSINHVSGV